MQKVQVKFRVTADDIKRGKEDHRQADPFFCPLITAFRRELMKNYYV